QPGCVARNHLRRAPSASHPHHRQRQRQEARPHGVAKALEADGTGKPASFSGSAGESSVREQLSLGIPTVGEVEHEPTDLVSASKPATKTRSSHSWHKCVPNNLCYS